MFLAGHTLVRAFTILKMQALSFSASLGQRVVAPVSAAPARRVAPAITASQVLEGKVVSAAGSKTAVVLVSRKVPHPRYKKLVNKSKRYQAHDEDDACKVGDVVRIQACRPMSRTKRFTLKEICSADGCKPE